MDRREFIKRVLQGERSSRLPRALFGGGRWAWRQTGLKPEDVDKDPVRFAERLGDFYRDLDTDII